MHDAGTDGPATRARKLAEQLTAAAVAGGVRVATAESCTGGLLAGAMTDTPGASAYYAGGIVAYADEVKIRHLGVDPGSLEVSGAVSETVAIQMADGACRRFLADVSLAVTGIAGPGGGTPDKPVGTVWMAVGLSDGTARTRRLRFAGDRSTVRARTVEEVLSMALDSVGSL